MIIKLNKGLSLTKETLTKLEDKHMLSVKGQGATCKHYCCRKHSGNSSSEITPLINEVKVNM